MAARRLIAVLIVLIVVSSIAAAIAPSARRAEPDTPSTATNPATESTATGGEIQGGGTGTAASGKTDGAAAPAPGTLVERTLPADTTGKPKRIEVTTGDELILHVTDPKGAEIEIPDLGQIDFANRTAPARFDLLLHEAGKFPITRDRKTTVATIVVSEPRGPGKEPRAERTAKPAGANKS